MTAQVHLPISDGPVLIGSDLHAWPGETYPAFNFFLSFLRQFTFQAVILNGDVIHGARISRHARIGWEKQPMVAEELAEAKRLLGMVEELSGPAPLIWTLGNHDARFETRIAAMLPEYEKIQGMHLKDHFPRWRPAWAVHLGGAEGLIVKHRYKGGAGAARANVLAAGHSIATGHTHQLGVVSHTDYAGTRYGIETGMLGDPHGPQFSDWLEENPRNWRMGFAIASFRNGRLLYPEVAHVRLDGVMEWRGEEWRG